MLLLASWLVCETSPDKNMFFPPYACRIYPHVFRMTIGLRLLQQPYPTYRPYMRFLSIRPDFCHRLPSDSTSRWTPLPLAICFPSLGRIRDFHPLEHAHAGRTAKVASITARYNMHFIGCLLENNVTLICVNYDEPLTETHLKDKIKEVISF